MKSLIGRLYDNFLQDDDCPSFIREVSRNYVIGTIEKLSRSPDLNTRKASVLAMGFLGDFRCNSRLGHLFRDPHPVVRSMAEQAIQRVWFRVGTEAEQRELMMLERLNLTNEFNKVVRLASRLIESNANIPEAWNQRAIANFNLMKFTQAIKDGFQTLSLNPYHYPAAIGIGNCYLEINDTFNAIENFKRALSINPGLKNLRAQINFLSKSQDHPRG